MIAVVEKSGTKKINKHNHNTRI